MRISQRSIVFMCLVFVFFADFWGLRYFFQNRVQELAQLVIILLFLYGGFSAAFLIKKRDLNLGRWVLFTALFLGYIMLLPAYLFSRYFNVSMIPSVLASREFLVVLICPTLWFLYRIGVTREEIERALIVALLGITCSYLIFRYTINLESWYFSGDIYKSSMVTYDFRGYRLKPPTIALHLLFYVAVVQVFNVSGFRFLQWFLVILLAGWAIYIQGGRSANVGIVAGIFAFYIFFKTKHRIPLLIFAFPALAFGLLYLGYSFIENMSELSHGVLDVRARSYQIGFNAWQKHFLFGVGKSSNFTLTDAQVFWKWFDPTDIGLLGVAYRYGTFGVMLYILGEVILLLRLVVTHFSLRELGLPGNVIVIACIMKLCADLLKYLLTVDYLTTPGLLLASIIISLTSIAKYEMKINHKQYLR